MLSEMGKNCKGPVGCCVANWTLGGARPLPAALIAWRGTMPAATAAVAEIPASGADCCCCCLWLPSAVMRRTRFSGGGWSPSLLSPPISPWTSWMVSIFRWWEDLISSRSSIARPCRAAAAGVATGKNLRGVAVKPCGGREGLAGREWEELRPPGIWEKKVGSVKCEVEGGTTGRVNLVGSIEISFTVMSLCAPG